MLDSFVQGQIIGMHMAGVKSRRIATELQVNDRTVRSIIKRYQERGTIAPKPIPGRPRKHERLNGAIAVPAVVSGEGGAEVGEEDGGSMDMDVDTSKVLATPTPVPAPAPAQTTVTTKTTTETVEWVISKKTGKLIKKRGKRGPYKKREKSSVASPSVPVTIAPHPHIHGHTSGGEGGSVVATATGTAGAQDKYVFSAQGSALVGQERQDEEEDEGAESEDYYSA
ncbi:hypothetical protein BGZ96_005008 [Linnemannia gamsii]|uniref:Paired domain-containing protein n=1 Tax=Linnemannia gamsii TaxID=64522 RepID=A0ABQ7JHU2_9FUNG|nr:hypothetical protein BGZ96_005008 [Linnemannia gamsii]